MKNIPYESNPSSSSTVDTKYSKSSSKCLQHSSDPHSLLPTFCPFTREFLPNYLSYFPSECCSFIYAHSSCILLVNSCNLYLNLKQTCEYSFFKGSSSHWKQAHFNAYNIRKNCRNFTSCRTGVQLCMTLQY